MKYTIAFIGITLLSLNLQAEVMWVGDPNFEARGCVPFGNVKLAPTPVPECNSKSFCMGTVSCYFIHKDILKNNSNWAMIIARVPNTNPKGINNWIKSESGVLCPTPDSGNCNEIQIDNCANLPASKMGCSMKKAFSDESFQVIPKEEQVVK